MATIRQKRLAKELANNNDITTRDALVKVGYSPLTNPDPIVKSPTFQALLDKYLPDRLVARTHKSLLKANKIITATNGNEREFPDYMARAKGVELAYKVKGKLIDNATQVNLEGIQIHVKPSKWEDTEDS